MRTEATVNVAPKHMAKILTSTSAKIVTRKSPKSGQYFNPTAYMCV